MKQIATNIERQREKRYPSYLCNKLTNEIAKKKNCPHVYVMMQLLSTQIGQ